MRLWKMLGMAGGASALCYCAKQHNYLHIWGNGMYDPRPGHPEDLLNFSNFSPKLVSYFKSEKSPNLKSVSFGPGVTTALDEKGDVYIWPEPVLNACKLPNVDDKHREVKLLHSRGNFTDLKWTKKVLFALNKKGEVWQWRFDLDENPKVRKVPSLKNITKIATGEDHFVALNKEGQVFTMGDDTFGQCGQEEFARQLDSPYLEIRYPNPLQVKKIPKKVTDIACGKYHTVAVLEDGQIMGWGRNNKNQLGDIEIRMGRAPAPVSYEPNFLRAPENVSIKKVAAGEYFSIFVGTDGESTELYGCGLNSRGQLALGYLTHSSNTIKIQNLSNFVVSDEKGMKPVEVKQVECGKEHCLALLDVGAVYSWGGNEHGEQGNKKRLIQDRPKLLKRYANKQVLSVHCGQNNSAVIWTK